MLDDEGRKAVGVEDEVEDGGCLVSKDGLNALQEGPSVGAARR